MKTTDEIRFDESSLEDTAKVLMKINPLDWGSADAMVRYMKSQTYAIMCEKEDKQFTHWGTAGFYVTVFPNYDFEEDKEPSYYYASATLMSYTVAKSMDV